MVQASSTAPPNNSSFQTQAQASNVSRPVETKPLNKRPKKGRAKKIIGIILLILVLIGFGVSYWLTQQSQDIRQQADTSGDYDCEASGTHHLVRGYCIPLECTERSNGNVVCSGGGDHCVDLSGNSVPCADLGMIRCDCDYAWVIGMASSCVSLCGTEPVPSNPPPSNPPPSNPPPSNSPPNPQCLNITMDKQEVEVGDQVVFQCGQVPEASRYIFRIKYPDGSIENIPAKSDIIYHSQPVTIESSGDYVAQCQICTDPSSDSCGPWETITH